MPHNDDGSNIDLIMERNRLVFVEVPNCCLLWSSSDHGRLKCQGTEEIYQFHSESSHNGRTMVLWWISLWWHTDLFRHTITLRSKKVESIYLQCILAWEKGPLEWGQNLKLSLSSTFTLACEKGPLMWPVKPVNYSVTCTDQLWNFQIMGNLWICCTWENDNMQGKVVWFLPDEKMTIFRLSHQILIMLSTGGNCKCSIEWFPSENQKSTQIKAPKSSHLEN